MDDLLFESISDSVMDDLTAPPAHTERPLTYGDLYAMINPILTRLDRIESVLNNVYSRQDIDRMVAERNQAIEASERRQYKYVEKVLNDVGTRFENTVNGLAKQIATLTDRVEDVIATNAETARQNRENAQQITSWSSILRTEHDQNEETRSEVRTIKGDVRMALDRYEDMDDRMGVVVTRTNTNAQAVAELQLTNANLLDLLKPLQQYVKRQEARRGMWTTFGRNLLSIVKSPRGLAIMVGWGAWLTGLETGTVQDLIKQLVQLLGG